MSSESLYTRATSLFPRGVNSPVRFYEPYPRFIKSGNGSKIIDEDGKEYIDYCLAFGPMILGHSRKEVVERIREQVSQGVTFGAPGRLEVELGELIREAIPSMEMMRFTNSGTEATMHAIRLARFFTGRNLILKVEGGFHGSHDYTLQASRPDQLRDSPGLATIEVPFNDTDTLQNVFSRFGGEIAAFIVEPVLGNVGVVPPEKGYLELARKLTQENGALLIFDEVITGFRFKFGGYQDVANIKPDLTTLGKIAGGGLPIGVFGGRSDIMKKVAPEGKFYQQGTFSGNPVTMAAGLATLQILKSSDYNVPSGYASRLSETLGHLFRNAGIPMQVNQIGTMFTAFFNASEVRDNASALRSDTKKYGKFFNVLLKNGIFVPKSQFEAYFLSFAHDRQDIERTESVFRLASEELASAK